MYKNLTWFTAPNWPAALRSLARVIIITMCPVKEEANLEMFVLKTACCHSHFVSLFLIVCMAANLRK